MGQDMPHVASLVLPLPLTVVHLSHCLTNTVETARHHAHVAKGCQVLADRPGNKQHRMNLWIYMLVNKAIAYYSTELVYFKYA